MKKKENLVIECENISSNFGVCYVSANDVSFLLFEADKKCKHALVNCLDIGVVCLKCKGYNRNLSTDLILTGAWGEDYDK